jgi:hypothetical protein
MIELILDIFKFRINKAFDKSSLRMSIERKFKKNKVAEIPNLVAERKPLSCELSLRGVRNERLSNPLISKRLLRSCFPRNDRKSVNWRVFVQALI